MSDRSRLRLFVLRVLVVSLLATLFGRLWYLQVLAGGEYSQAALSNRIREVVMPAARGQILDDMGRPLVRNRTSLVVSVNNSVVRRLPDHGIAVLGRLAAVIGVPSTELEQKVRPCGGKVKPPCWNGSPYQPVPVFEDAQPEMALRIQEHREDFPGVTTGFAAIREYPQGALAAHSLGYLSPISDEELKKKKEFAGRRSTDLVGRSGLEQSYDADLRGVDGVTQVTVDNVGTVTGVVQQTPPAAGGNLVLTLDSQIQKVAEDALAHAVGNARGMQDKDGATFRADSGAAVVMEADTGRVVALASYPSYDPSVFVGGISLPDFQRLNDPAQGIPLISRATQGEFAPGSTFKVISTASAVGEPFYSLGQAYPCPPSLKVGPQVFRNFESEELGGKNGISLQRALVKSCDTVYYKFGIEDWQRDRARIEAKQKPLEPMVAMAKAFGLGSKTGIDLPSESAGRIADRAFRQRFWEQHKDEYCAGAKNLAFAPERRQLDQEFCADGFKYRGGDAVQFAVGQGDTVVTPLQLAVAYAAIANGGTVYEPRLARAVLAPDGHLVRDIPPVVRGRLPVSSGVLAYIRDALAGVPGPDGTAKAAYAGFPLDQLPVAGKTGTAEVVNKQDTSWFASFAPATAPRYVVVAMIAEAGQGGKVAAPLTREIYEGIWGLAGRPSMLPPVNPPLPQLLPDGTVAALGPAPAPGALPVALPAPVAFRRDATWFSASPPSRSP